MESHVMGVACDGAGVDSKYTTQDFESSVDVRWISGPIKLSLGGKKDCTSIFLLDDCSSILNLVR